jgi:AraC-like DNA-binding protein
VARSDKSGLVGAGTSTYCHVVQEVLSTEQVPPHERIAYWREVICAVFIQLDVTQTVSGRFRGAVRTTRAGSMTSTRIRTDPMIAERSPRHLRTAQDDRCLLALQLRGRTRGSQDGRQVVLGPGDLALFDSRRAYRVDFHGDRFDHLVLQFPHAALAERGIDPSAVTARRVGTDSTIGRLVSPFLVNASQVADQAGRTTAWRLGEMSLDLIASALATTVSADHHVPAATGDELYRRIQLYLQLHISDPQLSPPRVAAAHNISLRQLHRLFARDGTTFRQWLRNERLRRCYDDFRSPQLAGRSIADIAKLWGITDAAWLSRAFRSRYGLTPREHRRTALAEPSR